MDAGREWALRMFGEAGPAIRAQIPAILAGEHEASSAAQDAWGHEAQLAYGNIWFGLLKAFERFGKLPGATLMHPGRATYWVPVVNRTTLFVWRYGRSKKSDLEATAFATSPARAAVPSLFQETVQLQLPGEFDADLTDEDRELLELLDAVRSQPQTTNRLVVVAVACSIHGLHKADWGEMSITNEGYPRFIGEPENLLAIGARGPASTSPRQSFTDGEMPERKPAIRTDEDTPADRDE